MNEQKRDNAAVRALPSDLMRNVLSFVIPGEFASVSKSMSKIGTKIAYTAYVKELKEGLTAEQTFMLHPENCLPTAWRRDNAYLLFSIAEGRKMAKLGDQFPALLAQMVYHGWLTEHNFLEPVHEYIKDLQFMERYKDEAKAQSKVVDWISNYCTSSYQIYNLISIRDDLTRLLSMKKGDTRDAERDNQFEFRERIALLNVVNDTLLACLRVRFCTLETWRMGKAAQAIAGDIVREFPKRLFIDGGFVRTVADKFGATLPIRAQAVSYGVSAAGVDWTDTNSIVAYLNRKFRL